MSRRRIQWGATALVSVAVLAALGGCASGPERSLGTMGPPPDAVARRADPPELARAAAEEKESQRDDSQPSDLTPVAQDSEVRPAPVIGTGSEPAPVPSEGTPPAETAPPLLPDGEDLEAQGKKGELAPR